MIGSSIFELYYSTKCIVTTLVGKLRDSLNCLHQCFCLSEMFCQRVVQSRYASKLITFSYIRLDGIVLSPQGRSFARGCQVNAGKPDGGVDVKNKLSGRPARGWPEPREKGWGRARVSLISPY